MKIKTNVRAGLLGIEPVDGGGGDGGGGSPPPAPTRPPPVSRCRGV